MCNNRMWAVEMVRGGSFNGAVMRVDPNVPSRITCARICLTEIKFDCASATYDSIARTCALSAEDRHTQPSSFELRSTSTDYLENQCISGTQHWHLIFFIVIR